MPPNTRLLVTACVPTYAGCIPRRDSATESGRMGRHQRNTVAETRRRPHHDPAHDHRLGRPVVHARQSSGWRPPRGSSPRVVTRGICPDFHRVRTQHDDSLTPRTQPSQRQSHGRSIGIPRGVVVVAPKRDGPARSGRQAHILQASGSNPLLAMDGPRRPLSGWDVLDPPGRGGDPGRSRRKDSPHLAGWPNGSRHGTATPATPLASCRFESGPGRSRWRQSAHQILNTGKTRRDTYSRRLRAGNIARYMCPTFNRRYRGFKSPPARSPRRWGCGQAHSPMRGPKPHSTAAKSTGLWTRRPPVRIRVGLSGLDDQSHQHQPHSDATTHHRFWQTMSNDDPADTTSSDLTDFGGGVRIDPPRIQKHTKAITRTPDGTKTAGFFGSSPQRGADVFITTRDSERHRLRALASADGGAYAISLDVIAQGCGVEDVAHVFVHETDTDSLYEWRRDDFRDGGGEGVWRTVPDPFLEHADDPQAYCPRDTARHVWDTRDYDLYIPRGDESPTDGGAGR